MAEAALTTRAGQTKAAIIEAALSLFRESGYEATTMRAIARRAGVSTGNAYYYFGSKEELIQEFYARNTAEHAAASRAVLDTERAFPARLRGTLRALIDVLNPYHEFAAKYFKHAAEPSNPLSPFSAESSAARDGSIGLYREVIEGSALRLDAGLRARLPELLWLYSLGIVLYWVHDTSPGRARSYYLIDRTVPLVDRLIRMSRLPMLRSTLDDVLALVTDLRPDAALPGQRPGQRADGGGRGAP
jgi:AcrR family transcriptional regulator